MKYEILERFLRAGAIPIIRCEPARPAKSQRRIRLISKVAFQRWLETAGTTTRETAALALPTKPI
jgi:hypothetical protein